MNPRSDTSQQEPVDPRAGAPAPLPATRPLYWSVRREVWENRSIYIAPLVVTAVVLLGSLIHLARLPRKMQSFQDPAAQQDLVAAIPFSMAPAPIMLAALLVGAFYSLEALHAERRDRSILFWKSLPVSDLTTVLSKASIPLVVLPLIAFVLGVATFVILLLLTTLLLLANEMSPAMLWTGLLFQKPVIMLYGLTAHALWFAPIYGWLLLVSAWARRAPFLWAVLPPLAVSAVEKIGFSTSYFKSMLRYRVTGAMAEAFAATRQRRSAGIIDHLSQLDPGRFLSSPGLWIGLAFTAACLAAAVRLRRNREPI